MPEPVTPVRNRVVTLGAVPASSAPTYLTASATPHVMGSWVELSSAIPHTTSWLRVAIGSAGDTDPILVDIGVGGGGSEVAVVRSLALTPGRITEETIEYLIPYSLPAGVRVSARMQSLIASNTTGIVVYAISGGWSPLTRRVFTPYGIDAAASGGTIIDTGAVANTDSAWVELAAATTHDHHWWNIAIQKGIPNPTIDGEALLDLAIGPASSEVEVVSDLLVTVGNTFDTINPKAMYFPYSIPAGTRLSARMRSTIIGTNDRKFHIALYGS